MMEKCSECGQDFCPDEDEQDICLDCQEESLRENVPEAFSWEEPGPQEATP
jgi:hypothetical protein